MNKVLIRVFAVIALTAASVAGAASASAETIQPGSVVLDHADMFTPAEETELVNTIAAADEKYDLTYVVETVASLNGTPISSYATDRANTLAVGNTETDNGVFVLISQNDREIWFALGSGVSPTISDQAVTSIVDSVVIPQFKEGDFLAGTEKGIIAVGDKFIAPARTPAEPADFSWVPLVLVPLGGLIFFTVIVTAFIKAHLSRKRRAAAKVKRDASEKLRAETQAKLDKEAEIERFYAVIALDIMTDAFKKRFENASTDKERMDIVEVTPRYRKLINAVPSPVETFDLNRLKRSYLSATQVRIDDKLGMPRLKSKEFGSLRDGVTVKQLADAYSAKRKAAKKKEEEERNARKKEAQAKAEKAARIKAEAKAYWSNLTDSEKKAIRRARSKQEKIRVMERHNKNHPTSTQTDMSVLFPVLVGLYASQIQESSSHSSSSYSGSSSSSSSSYSSSSYDSGGSFDGGGGGGSW